jgi:hypothetical protein
MNVSVDPIYWQSNPYDSVNTMGTNPVVLVLLFIIIIIYFMIFSSLGTSDSGAGNLDMGSDGNSFISSTIARGAGTKSKGASLIELLLWGFFLVLILINGIQYFFDIDISTSIKGLFTDRPEVDITVHQPEVSDTIPEIKVEPQVFNIPGNNYTYDDAKALCTAYGADLANYNQVEKAYNKGAEWCNFGWSAKQMALYPTQKDTWHALQKKKGHEHDCGRPGINGGFMNNPNFKFGVNCFGYKPVITPDEQQIMDTTPIYPITQEDIEFEKQVDYWESQLPAILVSPFNKDKWSRV